MKTALTMILTLLPSLAFGSLPYIPSGKYMDCGATNLSITTNGYATINDKGRYNQSTYQMDPSVTDVTIYGLPAKRYVYQVPFGSKLTIDIPDTILYGNHGVSGPVRMGDTDDSIVICRESGG